jgi:hypothetical protein
LISGRDIICLKDYILNQKNAFTVSLTSPEGEYLQIENKYWKHYLTLDDNVRKNHDMYINERKMNLAERLIVLRKTYLDKYYNSEHNQLSPKKNQFEDSSFNDNSKYINDKIDYLKVNKTKTSMLTPKTNIKNINNNKLNSIKKNILSLQNTEIKTNLPSTFNSQRKTSIMKNEPFFNIKSDSNNLKYPNNKNIYELYEDVFYNTSHRMSTENNNINNSNDNDNNNININIDEFNLNVKNKKINNNENKNNDKISSNKTMLMTNYLPKLIVKPKDKEISTKRMIFDSVFNDYLTNRSSQNKLGNINKNNDNNKKDNIMDILAMDNFNRIYDYNYKQISKIKSNNNIISDKSKIKLKSRKPEKYKELKKNWDIQLEKAKKLFMQHNRDKKKINYNHDYLLING